MPSLTLTPYIKRKGVHFYSDVLLGPIVEFAGVPLPQSIPPALLFAKSLSTTVEIATCARPKRLQTIILALSRLIIEG